YVLSIPFFKKDKLEYGKFFIRRIFRIYGPYLVTLGLGYLGLSIFIYSDTKGFSDWFNKIWSEPVSGAEWVRLLSMGQATYHNLVTSLWTLPIEVKISLALPFIILMLKRMNVAGCFLVLFGSAALYYTGRFLGLENSYPGFNVLYYLPFFVMGSIAYRYRHNCVQLINRLDKKWILAGSFAAILLYTFKWNQVLFPGQLKSYAARLPTDYLAAIAAVFFILLSISQKAPRFLENKYLIHLGRISFSLYLIHPVVMGVLGHLIGTALPFPVLILIIIITSLALSVPFFNLIEQPLQLLGRRLSDRLESKPMEGN
ncbi:MAG: acyltransferase, partial [Chitinophagaceae bacterium]|nr:acyltransferase [Chitinophagaceae bacterium]